MNNIYNIIWSAAQGCLVVVGELSGGQVKKGRGTAKRRAATGSLMVVLGGSLCSLPTWADNLPSGGQVVAGNATIHTVGNNMTINQSSNHVVTNWQDFLLAPTAALLLTNLMRPR